METFNLPDIEQKIYDKMKTFIVIGAFDGESHDNFFQKIKEKQNKLDNKIIFVEPVKKYYDLLTQKVLTITDTNISCENFGISDKTETVTMISVKPNLLDKYGWYIEGCACVVENGVPINIYMQKVEKEDLDYENINCITFNDLLDKNNLLTVDFLQIDTEGYDERIVKFINFETTNINFLKFEKHYLTEGFIEEFQSKLEPLGYLIYWDNDNYYFIKRAVLETLNDTIQENLNETLNSDLNVLNNEIIEEPCKENLVQNTIKNTHNKSTANISFYGSHNAAVVVEQNNKILCVIEIERFLNVKNAGYSQYLTCNTRQFLLKEIVKWVEEKYGISEYENCYYLNSDTNENNVMWHYEKLIPAKNYHNSLHHLSHAACGLYQSSHDEALIVSFDGGGNDGFFNIYYAPCRCKINEIARLGLDLGFPYMSFGDYLSDIKKEPALNLGNLVYSGKIMGLCSYGNLRQEWLQPMKEYYFAKPDGLNYLSLLEVLGQKIGLVFDQNKRLEGQESWDLAKTSQIAFEEVFLDLVRPYLEQYKNIPLILVGGCALNILLNTRLKKELGREVFVPPNPNDCGIASGLILNSLKPKDAIDLTYSGIPILDKDKLMSIVESERNSTSLDIKVIANELNQGKIIGVVRDTSEHGPRALGNRSIICDPTKPNMKDILNEKVKNREWYRPFAPVVRLEDVSKYFEFEGESRWMSFCPKVRDEWREKLISITHVDGTARVQTVTKEQNEWLYDLLTEFEKVNGVGVLLNTSFNVDGKPILSTYSDALHIYHTKQLDGLILQNYYINK